METKLRGIAEKICSPLAVFQLQKGDVFAQDVSTSFTLLRWGYRDELPAPCVRTEQKPRFLASLPPIY